jgi:hypothetical protein
MFPAFTPEIEQRMNELSQIIPDCEGFWRSFGLPYTDYLDYLWRQHWGPGTLTAADMWRAAEAVQDPATSLLLAKFARNSLAEQLRLARRLEAQQVPYVLEFAYYLLARQVPKEQLHDLLNQVSEADAQDVDFMFTRIADLLLNRLLLCVGAQRYRLREIEFYFRRPATHDDPYIHGEAEQQQLGRWYYNLAGGIDLTFGRQELGTWGGILLRGVERVPPAPDELGRVQAVKLGYVSGPQNVLRDILASLNGVFEQPRGLWLDEVHSAPGEVKWRARRYNLKHKPAADADYDFLNRRYRFLTDKQYVLSLKLKDRSDILSQLSQAEAQEIVAA